jgi:signal transduction histidine kinase
LAEDLLVIARSEDGSLPIHARTIEARDVLRRVASRFDLRSRETGRRVVVDVPDGVLVSADSVRLEQAIGNLVDNSLRYGGGDVCLCAEVREGSVEIHVMDAGDGFPESFLPRAFERFSRGGTRRSSGGAGLGLAIVAAIAEAHGGAFGATNGGREGGADVWLSLPTRAAA